MLRRQTEIDGLLSSTGLKLIGQGTIKYSEESDHGYTYLTGFLQSGGMIHTYPEYLFATAMFETCAPLRDIMENAAKQLKWFYGSRRMELIWAPDVEFPTTIYAEEAAEPLWAMAVGE